MIKRHNSPGAVTVASSRGFTLIEILVVMLLIAVLASVVSLTIGQGNQRRDLANEAQRLHAILRMAADEAIFQNVEIGVALDEQGYEFLGYNEEKQAWVALPQPFLRPRTFPDWVWIEFNREQKLVELPIDEEQETDVRPPNFVLLSSGESTPFRLRMGVEGDQDYAITIYSDGLNEIQYEEPTDKDD